jgi:sugar phosphate isomerase/epimerase
MLLGYNTNGLAEHDLLDAIRLLAEIGYRSVAITINHGCLSPRCGQWRRQADDAAALLRQFGMRSVIETGARFLLDPRHKHEPTLMTADAARREARLAFLRHAIDVAQHLESDCVSCWSGVVRDEASDEQLLDRLKSGLRPVLDYAAARGVILGFEPEPGMFVDTIASFERLLRWIDSPQLRLTLDVGHLYCQGEVPIADYIHRCGSRIVNVHVEDMKAGVHEHLMFGEGEMDFPPILRALRDAGFEGGLHVELSRHSHLGPDAARRAFDYLQPKLQRL